MNDRFNDEQNTLKLPQVRKQRARTTNNNNNNSTNNDSDEFNLAKSELNEHRLFFLLKDPAERKRLAQYVKKKNAKLYNEDSFELLFDNELDETLQLDKNLVVAATPKLGPGQLGVFAWEKDYETNELIAVYEGDRLFGDVQDAQIVAKLCKEYQKSGDFIWQVFCDAEGKTSLAVDCRLRGTLGRFVNHSNNPNSMVVYFNGRLYYVALRPIKIGEEIVTSYGKAYFYDDDAEKLCEIDYSGSNLKDIFPLFESYKNDNSNQNRVNSVKHSSITSDNEVAAFKRHKSDTEYLTAKKIGLNAENLFKKWRNSESNTESKTESSDPMSSSRPDLCSSSANSDCYIRPFSFFIAKQAESTQPEPTKQPSKGSINYLLNND